MSVFNFTERQPFLLFAPAPGPGQSWPIIERPAMPLELAVAAFTYAGDVTAMRLWWLTPGRPGYPPDRVPLTDHDGRLRGLLALLSSRN